MVACSPGALAHIARGVEVDEEARLLAAVAEGLEGVVAVAAAAAVQSPSLAPPTPEPEPPDETPQSSRPPCPQPSLRFVAAVGVR